MQRKYYVAESQVRRSKIKGRSSYDLIHEWEENCPSIEVEIVSLRTNIERLEVEKSSNENFV